MLFMLFPGMQNSRLFGCKMFSMHLQATELFQSLRQQKIQRRLIPLYSSESANYMNKNTTLTLFILISISVWPFASTHADELHVAVAANFSLAGRDIAYSFSQLYDHDVIVSSASTGKLYAQILHGAPYDVLLAADAVRPHLLEEGGQAIPGSRFTYAVGRLVLWSPTENIVGADGAVLQTGAFRHLAIANPELAPYGLAARQTLQTLGLWDALQPRIVKGESISQSFQFVVTRNAELGFVAAAQLSGAFVQAGSRWEVPATLHKPIEQQAIIIQDSKAARDFTAYLQSAAAREMISSYGYGITGGN